MNNYNDNVGGKTIRGNFNNSNNKGIMKKNPWEYYSCTSGSSRNPNINNGEDYYYYGSSCLWPPRSYACSFCKREFRSAQALGGHMNVHRRERARLRLNESPPLRDINLNLNPKSSPSPSPNNFFTPPPPFSRNLQSHDPSPTTNTTFTSLPASLVSPPLFSSCASSSLNFLEILKNNACEPADSALVIRSLSPKDQSDISIINAVESLFVVNDGFGGFIPEKESWKWMKNNSFVGLELGIGLQSEFKEDHVDLELRLGY